MKYGIRSVLGLFVFGAFLIVVEPTNLPESLFEEAEARVGRPLTPVSVAGVARRTTRRTVYATTAVVAAPVYAAPTTVVVSDGGSSYEEEQAALAQQQAAQEQQLAAQAQQEAAKAQQEAAEAEKEAAKSQQQIAYPVGATLPSLPTGCESTTVKDESYFKCGDNWFRPAMQNGNIVYAVVADPR